MHAIESVSSLEHALSLLREIHQADRQSAKNLKDIEVPLATLHNKLGQLLSQQSPISVPTELVILARLISKYQPQKLQNGDWVRLSKQIKKLTAREPSIDNVIAEALFASISESVSKAIIGFVHRLTKRTRTLTEVQSNTFHAFGKLIVTEDWLEFVEIKPLSSTLQRNYSKLLRDGNHIKISQFVDDIIRLFHMKGKMASEAADAVFETVYLPYMAYLVDHTNGDATPDYSFLLLTFERYVWRYTASRETREHFKAVTTKTSCFLSKSGGLLKQHNHHETYAARKEPARIAFLLGSKGVLAHTEALLSYLKGLKATATPEVEPFVFVLTPPPKEKKGVLLEERLAQYDVPILYRSEETSLEFASWLPKQCIKHQIAALVWVSVPVELVFWSAYKPAPVHIWWSMKYHDLHVEGLDGYITVGSYDRYRDIHGKRWRSSRVATPELYNPSYEPAAAQLKAKIKANGDEIIVGCFARDERFSDSRYIKSVITFLMAHPTTVFIWTGREKNIFLEQALVAEGVADRCLFIGWVQTQLWAQVIDVYADTFPFASGQTAVEAMAAGVPLVILKTPEALETSAAYFFTPLQDKTAGTPEEQERFQEIFSPYEGLPTIPVVESIEDYDKRVSDLCTNEAYRAEAGRKGKVFYQEFMRDEQKLSQSLTQHILEVIDEATSKKL